MDPYEYSSKVEQSKQRLCGSLLAASLLVVLTSMNCYLADLDTMIQLLAFVITYRGESHSCPAPNGWLFKVGGLQHLVVQVFRQTSVWRQWRAGLLIYTNHER